MPLLAPVTTAVRVEEVITSFWSASLEGGTLTRRSRISAGRSDGGAPVHRPRGAARRPPRALLVRHGGHAHALGRPGPARGRGARCGRRAREPLVPSPTGAGLRLLRPAGGLGALRAPRRGRRRGLRPRRYGGRRGRRRGAGAPPTGAGGGGWAPGGWCARALTGGNHSRAHDVVRSWTDPASDARGACGPHPPCGDDQSPHLPPGPARHG